MASLNSDHEAISIQVLVARITHHGFVDYLALGNTESVLEVYAVLDCFLTALVGQREGMADGGIAQGKGRNPNHGARHVGNANYLRRDSVVIVFFTSQTSIPTFAWNSGM